jgi:hypothetical protein
MDLPREMVSLFDDRQLLHLQDMVLQFLMGYFKFF